MFSTDLLKAAKGDRRTVIKSGNVLVDPTIAQIKSAIRKLSASVQGSITNTLDSEQRKLLHTVSDYIVSGELVIPFVAVIFKEFKA